MKNNEQTDVNKNKKGDFQLLFKDSPEYFYIDNAKMIQEGAFVRFITFDGNDRPLTDVWYPVGNIHRIKRYA